MSISSYELSTIVGKGKYPCYEGEVEAIRQRRMTSRLEWRRRMHEIRVKNQLIWVAWRVGFSFAAVLVLVLFSEALRLTVWTLLR